VYSKHMNTHIPAHVQNHLHFALSQQNPQTKILYTKKTAMIIKILSDIGCVHRFLVLNHSKSLKVKYFIWLSVFFYKNTPFFKSFRLISTPSKRCTISYKALSLLSLSIGSSVIILSTSQGLITHREALKKKTGGLLLYILS
jgi:ribosomal protein S8